MKTIFHFHLIVISSVLLSIDSCKSKKEATTTSPAAYSQPQTTTTSSPAPQPQTTPPNTSSSPQSVNLSKDDNVRFVVSFYSVASGIDSKVNDEFVKFMDSYPKKFAYTPKHWGREGEIDYCLALSELSSAEQAEFVKKATDILSKSKLVHQKENAKCDHANWPSLPGLNQADDSYRLVVQFYSKGEGIDNKTNEAFVKMLDSNSKKIAYEPTHWGREGEIDYCLKLNELSTAEQADFVKKANELLSKSALVHVNENAKCVHKH